MFTRKPYVDPARLDYQGVRLISLACPKLKFLETFSHTLLGVFAAKRLKPDILHIHAVGPGLLIPLARLMGFKVVMTHHGPDYKRKKWNWLGKAALRLGEFLGVKFANRVICVSETIAAEVAGKFGVKSAVIPNGVNIPRIGNKGAVLEKYGLEAGKYALAVGRFVPEKGFHDLIKAFALVRRGEFEVRSKDWKLVIVGEADHKDKYSRKLEVMALDNPAVVMTGFLTGEPLAELYSHAGLFALPSYYEGLPIALLEAMSYGLSCLVSDIPANQEIGLPPERYFKPKDIASLAKKLEEFIKQPLSEAERQAQINMVEKKYDWDDIAERTLVVYGRLL